MNFFRRDNPKCDLPQREQRENNGRARGATTEFERVVIEEVRRYEYDLRELAKS
jgi:hypothetical protein